MNETEFRELSAARALHALSPEEEQQFSAAWATHPEWTHIVDADRETAAALGELTEEVEPPAPLRASILDAIMSAPQDLPAGETKAPAVPVAPDVAGVPGAPAAESAHAGGSEDADVAAVQGSNKKRRAGWFALAASAAVLLALTLTPAIRASLTPVDPVAVALEQVAAAPDLSTVSAAFDGQGRATLHWSEAEQSTVFLAEGLPELSADHDFELWIVRDGEPISRGVVKADHARDTAAIVEGFEPGDVVAVTIEDRGGSPDGLPTTDPILAVDSA